MRFRHPDGTLIHLAYCTNVHPAEDVAGLLDQISRYAGPVRAQLGTATLGLGLWLPSAAASRLVADERALAQLRAALQHEGLEVVTLNAFPYAAFHAPVVKHSVYFPDWSHTQRLEYTLNCARVLAALLPDDAARGSISTLPLAWRSPWDDEKQAMATKQLEQLTEGLSTIADTTGRTIRVGLEPEPGCVVETAADAVERLAGTDPQHIGVCVDLCHVATEFDDPAATVRALAAAGVPVVKSQLSAALHAASLRAPGAREALSRFAEDRFLHQVRHRDDNVVYRHDDLPDALGDDGFGGRGPWRVHFHVPVHAEPQAPLRSTTDVLVEGMRVLVGGTRPVVDHLEVETYTWSVLPEQQRPTDEQDLVAGLAAELHWTRERLVGLGLTAL